MGGMQNDDLTGIMQCYGECEKVGLTENARNNRRRYTKLGLTLW